MKLYVLLILAICCVAIIEGQRGNPRRGGGRRGGGKRGQFFLKKKCLHPLIKSCGQSDVEEFVGGFCTGEEQKLKFIDVNLIQDENGDNRCPEAGDTMDQFTIERKDKCNKGKGCPFCVDDRTDTTLKICILCLEKAEGERDDDEDDAEDFSEFEEARDRDGDRDRDDDGGRRRGGGSRRRGGGRNKNAKVVANAEADFEFKCEKDWLAELLGEIKNRDGGRGRDREDDDRDGGRRRGGDRDRDDNRGGSRRGPPRRGGGGRRDEECEIDEEPENLILTDSTITCTLNFDPSK